MHAGSIVIQSRLGIREELRKTGMAVVRGEDFTLSPETRESWERLREEAFHDIPLDPYCEEQTRFRRMNFLILLPWEKRLSLSPMNGYTQYVSNNPDARREIGAETEGAYTRFFPGLTPRTLENDFLNALLWFDFAQCPFSEAVLKWPIYVGVHVIRSAPRAGVPSITTPNTLHKDGDAAVFVHLVERAGVSGGMSYVADNAKNIVCETQLLKPLDTLICWDRYTYHQLTPLDLMDGEGNGHRDVFIISFTPMRAAYVSDDARPAIPRFTELPPPQEG
jgi:hypothetical protein